jgi:hypothetical protein
MSMQLVRLSQKGHVLAGSSGAGVDMDMPRLPWRGQRGRAAAGCARAAAPGCKGALPVLC